MGSEGAVAKGKPLPRERHAPAWHRLSRLLFVGARCHVPLPEMAGASP